MADSVLPPPSAAPNDAVIEFRNITYSIPPAKVVLNQLNLAVHRGETMVLLGRSGSGKTTALKLINRLLVETSGEVRVEGKATAQWDAIALRRRIGYVIQESGLFPHYTIADNVGVVPRLLGQSPPRISARTDEMLRLVEGHRKKRTHLTYRYTLDTLLRQSCRKAYVDQVTREDILQFMTDCYHKRLGKRTVYDKVVVVLQLFKRYGKSGLLESNDWPDYVKTIRPIYEAEELEAMFRVASEYEATLIKFLLGSGLRDQEIRFLLWRDIDFKANVVRVTAKPQSGFTPKTCGTSAQTESGARRSSRAARFSQRPGKSRQ